MIKKLFFIAFIFSYTIIFSQQNKQTNTVIATPNPFTDSTSINVSLFDKEKIILTVKNVLGKTIFKKEYYLNDGKKSVNFKRGKLKSGIYLYTVQSKSKTISKRFVIN